MIFWIMWIREIFLSPVYFLCFQENAAGIWSLRPNTAPERDIFRICLGAD